MNANQLILDNGLSIGTLYLHIGKQWDRFIGNVKMNSVN
jgi:hypothetical protein